MQYYFFEGIGLRKTGGFIQSRRRMDKSTIGNWPRYPEWDNRHGKCRAIARTQEVGTTESVRDLSWKDIARTQEVGTTESVRDLSGDDLSSQDKEYYINDINIIHP